MENTEVMDISRLKKQLEEVFDEGYKHPSDVDIFAQPEPYEYALSESVDSPEDYEFVDVDAIHAESLREYMLSRYSEDEILEARGDIRKGLAAIALLTGIWGVNTHLAQRAYEASPQLQKLTAYLVVAKEHNDARMIDQLEKRIANHKMRLNLGKGDVLGPDGRPIDVEYDKSIKEDTDIPFHTCPKCGGEIFYEGEGKKDACYHKVKSRYKVWPSAYASGALVKCRKVGAKNWGEKSKK